jgi:hypothetical protein
VAALVTVVVLIVATQLPWLSELLSPGDRRPAGPRIVGVIGPWTHVNTWLPPFLGALVAVGAAFLGALGIGGLRPLGRHSEWLLLPFAPWLFVGMLPLSYAYLQAVNGIGLSGTFLGLVPPMLLSVPALVLLTLFFRGQSEVWLRRPVHTAGSFLRSVVLPALPLAGLLVGAVTLLGAQSLSWQMMVSRPSSGLTAPLALVGASRLLYDIGPGLTTPPAVVLPLLAALVAAQIWYLDRIAIRTGDPAR